MGRMAAQPATRWFQFRLRTLLLGFLFLAVIPGGYVAYQRADARRQKAAAEKLSALGAEIYARPNRLHSLLVPGAPGDVVGLAMRNRMRVDDRNLAPLADLSELVWIDLQATSVTDAGLVHLSGLKKLERLRLDETQISDAGLARLAGLANLRVLNLSETQITDAGLAHLKHLPRLEEVYLQKTQVTPAAALGLFQDKPNLNVIR
jgi:Leucine-rich repeat (LRR) protein